MKRVRSRAPLRLGLAGGGTDVAPFCNIYGGKLINITMSRYAYTLIESKEDGQIEFNSIDQNIKMSYQLDEEFKKDRKVILLESCYEFTMDKYNKGNRLPLSLKTLSDCPVGSGLGASSTLVVSILSALREFLGLPIDKNIIAADSYHVERIICKQAGGRQDQYSATLGGLNFMEFGDLDTNIVTPIKVEPWVLQELECSLLLYSSKLSRDSSLIIKEQSRIQKTTNNFSAMEKLKNEAERMRDYLINGDFDGIAGSLRSTWEAKKETSDLVTNDLLNNIYASAIDAGASAGKVSGAGGGGFMMFLIPPEKRNDVINGLDKYNGVIRNCHFSFKGCEAWTIN